MGADGNCPMLLPLEVQAPTDEGSCLPSGFVGYPQSPRSICRSADERWDVIHHDLQSLLSVAHHDDEVTRAVVWSRVDAETALAMVAGLAARAFNSTPQV